ncbi:MAG: hypothetical protein ACD_78C00252G0001 [uncultured bacterium (gcode 4)]|uniref:Uncharacterized protein n=1 Tax=uncultured bacterium (gcode 4) TaxID=1234023 RepID=K1XHL9_9BACT|nr:MAG: hypothetical protein ACD_78C00252G0001 [uncultured bacterium (gcode 4)]
MFREFFRKFSFTSEGLKQCLDVGIGSFNFFEFLFFFFPCLFLLFSNLFLLFSNLFLLYSCYYTLESHSNVTYIVIFDESSYFVGIYTQFISELYLEGFVIFRIIKHHRDLQYLWL